MRTVQIKSSEEWIETPHGVRLYVKVVHEKVTTARLITLDTTGPVVYAMSRHEWSAVVLTVVASLSGR
jgi:hypothetical protein